MSAFKTRRIREEKEPRRWVFLERATVLALRLGGPIAGWYRSWKERRRNEERSAAARTILKRTFIVLLAVLVCLFLAAGTVKALIRMKVLGVHTLFTVAGKELPADEDGYTNFLLLGRGDADHDGVDLTDTIMIASIDPKRTRSAILLSIPRDLYLLGAKNLARGRINEAYRDYKIFLKRQGKISSEEASKRAMRELGDELGQRLGLQIHHVVIADFTGFVKGVDALGGIDVDVPEDIVDTEYPGPNYSYQTFELRAGAQHLDGETALKYARSRHTTSDFARAARQQQILASLGEKARSGGFLTPGRITALWSIVADHVETTMSAGEALGLAEAAKHIDRDRIVTMQLSDDAGYETGLPSPGGFLYSPPRDQFDGASVLLPISIPPYPVTWRQLEAFATLLFRMRSIYLSRPQIFIYNAGAESGLARTLAEELTRYGLPVADTTNFPGFSPKNKKDRRPTSAVVPASEGQQNLALFFSTLLHIPLLPSEPTLAPEQLGQVTIILGEDYRYQPLQNLLLSKP